MCQVEFARRAVGLVASVLFSVLAVVVGLTGSDLRAEHEGKVQIVLLGDSTTEAGIPKRVAPQEPQFEDVIRGLLAAESDVPT